MNNKTEIIYSKYDFNDCYIINDKTPLNGILVHKYNKDRKLLTQEEYYNIETKKYEGIFLDLHFDISSNHKKNFLINNIFGIGTTKMCRILNNLSKKDENAKILKLIYNLEKLKIDNNFSGRFANRSRLKIKKIFNELSKYKKIKIYINKHKVLASYEYIIEYDNYLFCYHYLWIDNDFNILNHNKWLYKFNTINISKLFDIIYTKYNQYLN